MRNRLATIFSSLQAWVLAAAGLIVLLFVYYVAADRATPFTTDAYAQALVIQVAPRVEGQVTALHVANGSRVKQGDPLFEIDPRPFRYEVQRLEAKLVETKFAIKQLESALAAQKSLIKERRADLHYAQQTHDRIAGLAPEGAASQQKLDEATDQLSARRALLSRAQAEAEKLENQLAAKIGDDHASVKQVEAELAQAKLRLAWSTVKAPSDGRVDDLQLSVGTYIDAGTAVLSFVDTRRWWVVANYQENALSVIRPGQDVALSFFMYPGSLVHGRVESVGWGVSQGQGVPSGSLPEIDNPTAWIARSQRFQVRIAVDDMGPDLPLRVGATARVVVFAQPGGLMNVPARFWLWVGSQLDYIY